ncbi:helix-turn-helix domain-containing protein [Caldimonas tepidiphila]|uniref:helix-turn-helix domain-containing protein n=1 Tax=Caldimonas tepidiphila TaxID=2315841 RepID=UPI000E5C2252|nr:helix-turn-helix domain-containing protein [Caldimonas tepidiphila]
MLDDTLRTADLSDAAPAHFVRPTPGYHWMTWEEAILRKHYPDRATGPAHCAELLPHRALSSIYAKARTLGLSAPHQGSAGKQFARTWERTEAIDAALRAHYASSTGRRGGMAALAASTGRPRGWLQHRAAELGLTRSNPMLLNNPWSAKELELLEKVAHLSLKVIVSKLKAAGFTRTQGAVMGQIKRRKLDRDDPDRFTTVSLSQALGVCEKTVARWIDQHGLPAEREGAAQVRRVHRKKLRAWIAKNLAAIDLRRVDQAWFMDLVFGG